MILDGWGIAKNPEVSAIDKANTPFIDSLYNTYPNSKLQASGLYVGLPEGQMGNSEVGHMNLGAGRVVYQDLVKINKAIEEGELAKNPLLTTAFQKAKNENKKIHLIGLLSDGGVHSHINHLKGLCSIANDQGLSNVFVHAFTDGRDTDPNGGLGYIEDLEAHMKSTTGKLASIVGRYYAMDRDKRWERIKLAYDLLVDGIGTSFSSAKEAIEASYAENVTDEFILPKVIVDSNGNPMAKIESDDIVICFNFRTDRGRQISEALTQKDFQEHGMTKLNVDYITMTNYDNTFNNVKVLFDKDNLNKTLGEVIEAAGKQQIRIAETEKYPHVTFFFSGGREKEFEGERRLLIPSPKVATYDLKPEMSAYELKDAILPEINNQWPDFVCLNFANPDMVGHTGVMEAAMKACETVDQCAKEVVDAALANDYSVLILADHGNSDCMLNEDGTPNTAHTTQPVPWFLLDNAFRPELKEGKLGDVAPTILKLMGIEQPQEMTGKPLF